MQAIRHLPGLIEDNMQKCVICKKVLICNNAQSINGVNSNAFREGFPVIEYGCGISPDRGNWPEVTNCNEVSETLKSS